MDQAEARKLLTAAVQDRNTTRERADLARLELYAVVRTVAPLLKQVDIVRETGWTREHIRNIVEGKQ